MALLARIRRFPLAAKLAVPFACAAVLPFAVATLLEIQRVERQRMEDARFRLAQIARNLATVLGERIALARATAGAVAQSDEARALAERDPPAPDIPLRMRAFLRVVLRTSDAMVDIALVGPDGRVRISTDARDEGRPADEVFGPLAPPGGEKQPLAARERADRGQGRVLPVVVPVGASAARVVVLMSVASLERVVRPQIAGPGSYGALVGRGIGGRSPEAAIDAAPEDYVEEAHAVPGPGVALHVAYRVPLEVIREPFRRLVPLMATAGAGAALVAALVGALVAFWIGRRLAKLDAAAKLAVATDLADIQIDPGPLDEVGRLAVSWQETLGALATTRRELDAAAQKLQAHARELEARVEERTRELAGLNSELVRAASEASALARAASELGREMSLAAVVRTLSNEAKRLLGVDVGIVFLASKDGGELVPVSAHADDAERIGRGRIRVDDPASSSARAFRERRTVVLADEAPAAAEVEPAARSHGDPHTSRRLASELGARSSFAVPLLGRDRAIGVLLAGFREATRAPTQRELEIAETMAAEAGVALDRAQLLAELGERERDLRELFDKATDLIFAYGPDGRFTRANQATLAALGYTLDELNRRTFADVTEARAGAAAGADSSATLEMVLIAKSGRRIPVELRTRVVRREGEVVEIQVFGRDLGPRRELERRHLEGERLKTAIELAGATAHNLNQPLTGILGYVDMLIASASTADAEMLQQIRKQAVRMADIVKKMKSLTRVETENYVGSDRIVKLG